MAPTEVARPVQLAAWLCEHVRSAAPSDANAATTAALALGQLVAGAAPRQHEWVRRPCGQGATPQAPWADVCERALGAAATLPAAALALGHLAAAGGSLGSSSTSAYVAAVRLDVLARSGGWDASLEAHLTASVDSALVVRRARMRG